MAHFRVVLAEDETILRDLYEHVLRQHDVCTVRTARNGEDAIELIRLEAPDLLLLDIDMPILDGFGVLERLPKPRTFTVAMLTNSTDRENRVRATALGADEFLVKMDMTIDLFVSTVDRLLKRRIPS